MKHTLYILLIISLMFCASCTHTKYITREIPVEVVKTKYQNVFVHDSIHETDSIFVEIKGDTVTKEVFKTKIIYKYITDSVIKNDTIPQIITQQEIVEKKVPQWWPVWLSLGIFVILTIIYFIIKIKLKFK
jgi:hypothetical protein